MDGAAVTAVVEGTRSARPRRSGPDEPAACARTCWVDPAWRRQGIGSRLLFGGRRMAAALGPPELVLTTRADNQAVLPMVLAAGLRGRIRMPATRLTVRVLGAARSGRCAPDPVRLAGQRLV